MRNLIGSFAVAGLMLCGTAQAAFVAYVDMGPGTTASTGNILNLGLASSGGLVNYADGAPTGVTLTATLGSGASENAGGPLPASGDANTIFSVTGLNFDGMVQNQSWTGAASTLTFTGLNPAATYEVVIGVNRGSFAGRLGSYTITGAESFANTSSVGTTISGTNSETTSFDTGTNTNGYVARYASINPGADGAFTIELLALQAGNTANPAVAYAWNAVRLTGTDPIPEPASMALLGLGGLGLLRRRRH